MDIDYSRYRFGIDTDLKIRDDVKKYRKKIELFIWPRLSVTTSNKGYAPQSVGTTGRSCRRIGGGMKPR